MADYLLLWGGGGGDDVAKSPHLARIANSVYRDHCPDDPTCRMFGFVDQRGTPSAMMRRSLLYNLHGHRMKEGVVVPESMFSEVFRSKYGKVRIFKVNDVSQESKDWVADPINRKCDAPGSWYCPGSYPPGLQEFLDQKVDFAQLEDFNQDATDEEYNKRYMEDLKNPSLARQKAIEREAKEARTNAVTNGGSGDEDVGAAVEESKEEVYKRWEDTEDTVRMYNIIKDNNIDLLKAWLELEPNKAFVRSKDGRGPMFWAFELRNEEITTILLKAGVPKDDADSKGLTPRDLLEGQS